MHLINARKCSKEWWLLQDNSRRNRVLLIYNLNTIKFTMLIVYNLKILNTFTKLGNYLPQSIRTYQSPSKDASCLFAKIFCSHPQPNADTNLLFPFIDLTFLYISYKCNNTTCGLLSVWLSFDITLLSLIHGQLILILHLCLLPNNILVYGYIITFYSFTTLPGHICIFFGKYLGVKLYARVNAKWPFPKF